MKKFIARFLKDDKGVTAIEYGLLAGLITVAIIGAVTTVGADLSTVFTDIGNTLTNVATGVPKGAQVSE